MRTVVAMEGTHLMLPTSATPLLDTPAAPETIPWPRLARLLAAAAVVGAILGGMG